MSMVAADKKSVKMDPLDARSLTYSATETLERAFNIGVAAEACRVVELVEEVVTLMVQRDMVVPGLDLEKVMDAVYDVLYNDVRPA